jgi:hypothetical protein
MNKARLKTYAPQARRDFIAAVGARAHLLGLSGKGGTLDIAPGERKGDIAVIAGQAWPAKVHEQRERLIRRMQKDGFAQTVEAVAYTWFNRFAALRYMEIHDYLGHGHRVLSSREGGLPEIIAHATELAAGSSGLPGLNAASVAEMKLAGNQDGELYRLLLVAQCNALSKAMPFLFERIDDESELLLPGNLERTDSVVAKLVEAIPDEDWNEVEVIGWLYQFYISEKKDQVIGKVVKSEDIPAATQLFTPNWIVQYLVQNSVGRLWLMANPASGLKSQWPYYIEPAEQTPEVQAQLDALIKTRMDEDSPLPPGQGPGVRAIGSLNPETITVLDPACGSGHILVEAYAVLKGIYLERGYPARSIPRLILEKNLYGLDIDDRAAQLAGFALLMKARADDRRLLDGPIKLNVLSLQESAGMDLDEFAGHMKPHGIDRTVLGSLLDTFTHAKTFGSLIQIPKVLEDGLAGLEDGMTTAIENGDVFAKAAAQDLVSLVHQAKILAMKFDAVVANPPYMGAGYFDGPLKRLVESYYKSAKGDLYTCFIVRNARFAISGGLVGMITIPNWMFLSTFEVLRSWLCANFSIETFSHNGRGVFGSDFGSCAFTFRCVPLKTYKGGFRRLFEKQGGVASNYELDQRFLSAPTLNASSSDFLKIPGTPIAYWVSEKFRKSFEKYPLVGQIFDVCEGMNTADNERFLRAWHEVPLDQCNIQGNANTKWRMYLKGGEYRKWYGNNFFVINWDADGQEIKSAKNDSGKTRANIRNERFFYRSSINWSYISSSNFGVRWSRPGFIFDGKSPSLFCADSEQLKVLSYLLSAVANATLKVIDPTIKYSVGAISRCPFYIFPELSRCADIAKKAIAIAAANWDAYEVSWDFSSLLWVCGSCKRSNISTSWLEWLRLNEEQVRHTKEMEYENNRLFIEAYGLQDELSPEVPEDQITLNRADREKDSQRLISYAIGCMMGRYSLDKPGLIYAHAGNVGFDITRYKTFPADADGILPITDELWFEDDAAKRVREFLLAVWSAPTLDENMVWLAESLGTKDNETPDETLRRYLSSSFFKDHLQTYKKRPIYWLFSSGKQGAFQALVYLHRYHEGTLARMRAEYVVPLTGKIQSRIEMLEKDRDAATSTAARNRIARQIEALKKKHVELLAYDEKLRHYADMRISIDLDDGVKVNYGKFGDLLDSVKIVTGGASDD